MFQGVLALLERSLRIDARSWQAHLARFGLMMAIYISLAFTFASGFRIGAPGLRFFMAIVWLNITFLTLLGIGFFSTAISEEKEEDTLGLMQMAGISPLGILLGKIGGRLFQSLLLIAVQYPFTLLAVTLGGVTTNQVRCAFVGLTAYMLFMAGLGLFCSTVAGRNRSASGLMILGLVVYFFVPYSAYETHRVMIQSGVMTSLDFRAVVLQWVASTSLFLQVSEIMTSSFGDTPWSIQAISNLVGGGVCFLVAWAVFGICTRNPASESTSRGFLSRKRGAFRWFAPGRPRWNPYFWKDFHFVGGGIGMILVRIVLYMALLAICVEVTESWWGRGWNPQYPYHPAISMFQFFMLFLVSIETALLASRTVHEEIRGQTLATLCILPESMPVISYSKLAGALLAGAPGICFLGIISFATDAGDHNTRDFFRNGPGWFFLSHFALVPHLAMVFALYMRWGFVPLAIGVSVGSLFGWITVFQFIRPRDDNGIFFFAAFVLSVACAFCHVWVQLRIHTAAARG